MYIEKIPQSFNLGVLLAPALLIVVGLFGNAALIAVGLALLFFLYPLAYSINRYHAIELIGQKLVVGKETVNVSDIINASLGLPNGAEVRLIGGAYSKPFFYKSVYLGLKSGDFYEIASRHPDKLFRAIQNQLV